MTIESRVRAPKEGSARSKVFKAITEDNISIWDTRTIARETGLQRKQVTAARSNLREDGLLPKPTKELTRLTQHTQAATVFPLVQEHREIGLSLWEIQFAVKSEKGIDLGYESVHSAVVYNTKIGNIRGLSKEEKHDIKRDILMLTPEEISGNVTAILELRKKLLENGLPLPTNRLEWKVAIEKDYLFLSRCIPVPVITDLNIEDVNFLERLILNGIIDKNVAWFETLKNLYKERQSDFDALPPEIKLRLEAFTQAIMQEVQENRTDLRTKFTELGEQLDREWFYNKDRIAFKEQKFIADKLRNRGAGNKSSNSPPRQSNPYYSRSPTRNRY